MANMAYSLKEAKNNAQYFLGGEPVTKEQVIQIANGIYLGQSIKEAIIEVGKNMADDKKFSDVVIAIWNSMQTMEEQK